MIGLFQTLLKHIFALRFFMAIDDELVVNFK